MSSEGDIYVSSGSSSQILVFGPDRSKLATIVNEDEPCGLAVDSKGRLYALERATGTVVRYSPTVYPLSEPRPSGTPLYGGAETIDASGVAEGISVDPTDDWLYVAKGTSISAYSPAGTFGINEVQRLQISQAAGGSFRLALPGNGGPGRNEIQEIGRPLGPYTLSFEGQTTTTLEANASAAEVEAALEALSTIGPGGVSVVGFANRPKWIEFTGTLAETNVPLITSPEVPATALGAVTSPIPFGASPTEVEAALESLQGIGSGNVTVDAVNGGYRFTFEGALARAEVPTLAADSSALAPDASGFNPEADVSLTTESFSGELGEGSLVDATGVAAYTSPSGDRYLFAADSSTNQVKVFVGFDVRLLRLRHTIEGPSPAEKFGFSSAGAVLAVDPGNGDMSVDPHTSKSTNKCLSISGQACTTGHLFVYDDAHQTIDEFQADGVFLDRFTHPLFASSEPTAITIDRSRGAGDGTIYVGTDSGSGGEVLAFGPLVPPTRAPLPSPLSHELKAAEAVTTDRAGDVYVASEKKIVVYGPTGSLLTEFTDGQLGVNKDLVVDSECNLYVLENGDQVTRYTPSSSGACPPASGTAYTRHEPAVATINSFSRHTAETRITAIGINPATDHVFVSSRIPGQIIELDSAKNGSAILNPDFGAGLGLDEVEEVAAYENNGNVYVNSFEKGIVVLNSAGTEILARISGGGSPKGPFGAARPKFAVDQSNGHVLAFRPNRGVIEEYDASGAFVGQFFDPVFGEFQLEDLIPLRLAVDNSGGPSDGNIYLAYDQPKPGSPDVWAFGPLSYGEPPIAVTGSAGGLGGGSATLHGTVDPRGVSLDLCKFEYLTDSVYQQNRDAEDPPFTGAASVPCAESLLAIGSGVGPVSVHADLAGLDGDTRYRYRLLAHNQYGEGDGSAGLFGPPRLVTQGTASAYYDEATLRAEVDPSGLATEYLFEYGTSDSYGQTTAVSQLPSGDGPVAVDFVLVGLSEGTTYHFRAVAKNEAGTIVGPDQAISTRSRRPEESCPNSEYRIGLSAALPDCRAYEMVTPRETRGLRTGAVSFGISGRMNNWLVDPRGPRAGESVAFFAEGTLPGFDGNGLQDGYRSQRGAGSHPLDGWATTLFGPTFRQSPAVPHQEGVAADQLFSFWDVRPEKFKAEPLEGTLADGQYLRTPAGFEALGKGDLGTDMEAEGRFLSRGGSHVIFASKAHLQPEAAPSKTNSLYDRVAGADASRVVSVRPDGTPFGAGEDATYIGATEDGSAVVFEVGGALYLHGKTGQTFEVAAAPSTYAGISEDGTRVFFAEGVFAGGTVVPTNLFVCDVQAGPCVGPDAQADGRTKIAQNSIFVNVSADGSDVYFTSKDRLDDADQGTAGVDNLYLWNDIGTRWIADLDPQDLVGFDDFNRVNLKAWTNGVGFHERAGRGKSPTRTTPDGEVLVFQSHARLTNYDNQGVPEIYRYDAGAGPATRLTCVSCDPSSLSPTAGATLQTPAALGTFSVVEETTLIANLVDSGNAVFFQSPDRLVPEDANEARDVYEWTAQGLGSCNRTEGCLALISSGQGEDDNDLFGVSADGHDVFFITKEKLVESDVVGSSSIYDARIDGGIPGSLPAAPCQGDACQGQGSVQPTLPTPASNAGASKGGKPGKRRCPGGKRRVLRKGKARCVPKRHRRHHVKGRGVKGQGRGI